MNYRGPGFLAVVWFSYSTTPSPSPISRLSLWVFLCVAGRAFWRKLGGGDGGGAKSYDGEKTWSCSYHSICSLAIALIYPCGGEGAHFLALANTTCRGDFHEKEKGRQHSVGEGRDLSISPSSFWSCYLPLCLLEEGEEDDRPKSVGVFSFLFPCHHLLIKFKQNNLPPHVHIIQCRSLRTRRLHDCICIAPC
jgi:hypothetical protein